QVPIDAVVRGVQPAADEPLPERRIVRVERGVPVLVPSEQVSILLEALREIPLRESLEGARICQVRLGDERRRRGVIFLFPPVNGDLRLGELRAFLLLYHRLPPDQIGLAPRRLSAHTG